MNMMHDGLAAIHGNMDFFLIPIFMEKPLVEAA